VQGTGHDWEGWALARGGPLGGGLSPLDIIVFSIQYNICIISILFYNIGPSPEADLSVQGACEARKHDAPRLDVCRRILLFSFDLLAPLGICPPPPHNQSLPPIPSPGN
jgi:hypothetical protein